MYVRSTIAITWGLNAIRGDEEATSGTPNSGLKPALALDGPPRSASPAGRCAGHVRMADHQIDEALAHLQSLRLALNHPHAADLALAELDDTRLRAGGGEHGRRDKSRSGDGRGEHNSPGEPMEAPGPSSAEPHGARCSGANA